MMWIEVLSRHGEVAARERIAGDEARIGRAFDNDVVVNDPHVAPHHLRIYRGEDGELVAQDLGTLNGLYSEHGGKRVTRLPLASEPGIRIGRTVLRVHDSAHAVQPERLLTPPRAHARWAIGLGVLLFTLLVVGQWLMFTTEPSASVILTPALGAAAAIGLWSSAWAMQSRLFFGQARFAAHLRIAITAALAIVAWDQLAEFLSFALASRQLADYGGVGIWVVLAAACYAHLRAIDVRHMNFAMAVVVGLGIAGALLQYAGMSETQRLIGQRATLGDLRPPVFRVAPVSSQEDFFRKAEGAKRRVDQLRMREPAEPPE